MKIIVLVLTGLSIAACGGSSNSSDISPVIETNDGSTTEQVTSVDAKVKELTRVDSEVTALEADELVNNYNTFALSLFRDSAKVKLDVNSLYSPYASYTAFSQLVTAAQDDTLVGLQKNLLLTQTQDVFLNARNQLDLSLLSNTNDAIELLSKNILIANKGYDFSFPFLENNVLYFGSDVQFLDFDNDLETTKRNIYESLKVVSSDGLKDRAWVDSLSNTEKLVMINQFSFDAEWKTPFVKESGSVGQFTKVDLNTIDVEFMSAFLDTQYYIDESTVVVEIPTMSSKYSVIVATTKLWELGEFIDQLTSESLDELYSKMRPGDIALELPEFSLSAFINGVGESLSPQGFHEQLANFSALNERMSDDTYVKYSELYHELAFNREGITADAESALVVSQKPLPDADMSGGLIIMSPGFPLIPIAIIGQEISIKIDSPFIVILRDNDTNMILQLGLINDPLL